MPESVRPPLKISNSHSAGYERGTCGFSRLERFSNAEKAARAIRLTSPGLTGAKAAAAIRVPFKLLPAYSQVLRGKIMGFTNQLLKVSTRNFKRYDITA